MALAGVGATLWGLMTRFVAGAGLGLVAVVLATVAFLLHRRLGDQPLRTHAARRSRALAELASWGAVLPLSVALIALAVQLAPPGGVFVAGKPVEVRSWSRLVVMPDGRSFRFTCGSPGRPHNDCPALAKWRALPRWPEPERVEMEVSGSQILALRMDGQVIVDRTVDNSARGLRAAMILLGGGLAVAAIWAIQRRGRLLVELRRPSTSRRAPS